MSKLDSKRLKELRKKKKVIQSDVADAIGIGRTGYVRIENGEREADSNTLLRLADYFGVSVDYLLGRVESPAQAEAVSLFPNNKFDFQLFSQKGPAPPGVEYTKRAVEIFEQMSDEDKKKALEQLEMVLAYSKAKVE